LFLQGDNVSAEDYLKAAWLFSRHPTIADHLAQLYEKIGRQDAALKYSGLTIAALAAMDRPQSSDLDAAANSRERISRLALPGSANKLLQDTAQSYSNENSVAISNSAKLTGTAGFALLQGHEHETSQARLVTGDVALQRLAGTVASQMPRVTIPGDEGIDVVRWGTLLCPQAEADCTLKIATVLEATYAELQSKIKSLALDSIDSSNAYSSDSLGFSLRLPEGWSKTAESAATPQMPARVVFRKENSLCSLEVLRYHLQATEDTFNKLLDATVKDNDSVHQLSRASVVRDGVGGVRIIVNYQESEVEFHAIFETFTAGDIHYELVVVTPLDEFERDAAEVEKLLASIRFPNLHVDVNDLKPAAK
jgi:hypothetical protein